MGNDDVKKLAGAAAAKSTLLSEHPGKYLIRSLMAGFFIAVAMIYSSVVIHLFQQDGMPGWGKFLGALVFSLAVILITFVGGELFTGNNLVMAFGALDGSVRIGAMIRVWLVSYIGNFIGCVCFSWIWVMAGCSGTQAYFEKLIPAKLSIPADQMFFRAILCNFFVCLAVTCGIKAKEEAAKILLIMLCISGFVASGFEHSIANMAVYTVGVLLLPEQAEIGSMIQALGIVTLGNIIGGALLLAVPLRKMSAEQKKFVRTEETVQEQEKSLTARETAQ